ncbi:MAG: PilX N-terminal domain-containing pilus assembly protein [Gammaproteobacteria bacterium]|nr:PilX N-terminal domain-containing pilus assembly protein [Gammaproteobacteria bacterium]
MSRMRIQSTFARQSGAALFMALMFLIIITMLSLSAMRSSIMELRMAGNEEEQMYAVQRAQAAIDATVTDAANTPVIGGIGDTTCLPGAVGCTRDTLDLSTYPEITDDIEDGYLDVRVRRIRPLEKTAPRTIGTSASVFSYASFEVTGQFNGLDDGRGNAQVNEGVMVLISK